MGEMEVTWSTRENLTTLLGKMLRIDVSGEAYTVPETGILLAQLVVLKLKSGFMACVNPWKFSFDRVTGDLYIGDVGQNYFEEINFQPAWSTGGENYGWDTLEGTHCHEPKQGWGWEILYCRFSSMTIMKVFL